MIPPTEWPTGRTGHIAIVGRPNTGKSTFLNTVLGCHLAPVSAKPQTTRRRLLGIWSQPGLQGLFLDTPGLFEGDTELDRAMEQGIRRSLEDADVVLCLADPLREPGAEDRRVAGFLRDAAKPVLVGVNKSDLATPEQVAAASAWWAETLPDAPRFTFSAVERKTLDAVLDALAKRLPEGPFLYDPETLTDAFERDIGADLIRETVLEELRDEVPHAVAVEIEAWKEDDAANRRAVRAVLHVERPGQKAILIGRGGEMIKVLTRRSREKLETLCGMKVKLDLHVRVTADWRRKREALKTFGLAGARRGG